MVFTGLTTSSRSIRSLLLGTLLLLSGCTWMQDISQLERDVVFSVSINPSQIYEGQQASVEARLLKDYGSSKAVTWTILQSDGTAALASDFVEAQGSLSLSGRNAGHFSITSKPGSVASGSKEFKLVLSSENFSQDFTLTVMDSGTSSTISITSTDNSGYVNLANRSSYHVSGVCSTDGSDVSLVAEINGESVSGTTPCLSNAWTIPLNFSGVTSEGAVALSATHAGGAGSIAATTLQIQKDTVKPTVGISTPAAMSFVNTSNVSSFTLSGSCSEFSRIVSIELTSSGGGTPVVASGLCMNVLGSGVWSTTANISTLTDGTITSNIQHTDAAANSESVNRAFVKDTLVPTLTIASPASLAIYNAATYQALAVSGSCNKNGANVTLTGDVSGTLTATCNGTNFAFSGLTLTGVDGVKAITATIADVAGNQSQTNLSLQKDISIPTAILSGAPASFSNQISLNVTVGGSDVSQYLYKFGVAASTDCTVGTGYSAATGIATAITDNLGVDGAKKLCVRALDVNGNTQAPADATVVTWTKDTVLPVVAFTSPATGSYVNRLGQATFAVAGTCSEVGTNNVVISGHANATVNCVAGTPNTWNATVNLSAADDGPVFLLAAQTDAAGNVGNVARTFNKNTVDPTIAFTNPSAGSFVNNTNKGAFTVSGTCSTYSATPNITLTGTSLTGTVTTACDGANWTANLAFNNGDEAVIVNATIADVAGNTGTTNRSFTKDTNNPVLAITSPSAGSYINNANKAAFAVSGTCSDAGTNNVVVSGAATATVNCTAGSPNTWSANLNFTAATDGAVSITVTHTDAAGNTHAPTLALNKDVVAPVTGWTLPLAAACASDASGTSFKVSGTCTTTDGNVTLSSAQLGSSVVTACSAGNWSTTLNLNVTAVSDLASFNVQASQTDTAGNSTGSTRSFKKIASVPSVILGGWSDIYAVGVKTYADGRSAEPGTVRVAWKDWPVSNTCQPEAVKVYRATSSGGVFNLVSNTDYPSGIPANLKSFTDSTLNGSTVGTVGSPTDFNKGWYYRLKVTIAGTDYDVSSPAQIAEVRVVAPPDNMGLMHRWIANQEVCGLMGRSPDETNNYRCSYSGWGKIVGNYYDLQTDMLVDRFELGCNYSSNCGAGGNQLCVATTFANQSNPSAGAGIIAPLNSVYYDNANEGRCYLKTAAGDTAWTQATSLSSSAQRLAVSTPKAHVPPLVQMTQNSSYPTCQAHQVNLSQFPTDSFPKSKRLLRQKEWRAAVAWSPDLNFAGAGFGSYDAFVTALETGGSGRTGYCNSSNAHGGITDDRRAPDTPFAYPFSVFATGSHVATTQCQSRYGLQDMVGNVWEWTSDQLGGCTALGDGCAGVTSALDAGNTDMNGFRFDGINEGPNGGNEWYLQNQSYGATYFSIPLGLPMLNSDGGNAITISSWLSPNKFHDDYFWLYPGNGNVSRGLLVGGPWDLGSRLGRWASNWNNHPGSTNNTIGLRCGVPLQY